MVPYRPGCTHVHDPDKRHRPRSPLDEHSFPARSSGPVGDVESRVEQIRRSAAMAPLGAHTAHELLSIALELIEERREMRRVLDALPEDFAKVRQALNDLARTLH